MESPNIDIQQTFDNYHPQTKKQLLKIRQWIFEIGESSGESASEIGQVQECLKWGDPSYLTSSPKSGTTLILSQLKSEPSKYGLFVHCQTSLIEDFRVAYPDLPYDKNRGVLFDSQAPIQTDVIKQFIYLALTYHARKSN